MPSREEIAQQVKDDLRKSEEHLLIDVHQEILNEGRTVAENMVHAQKRLASLTVRSSITMKWLTWSLTALTVVLLGATIMLVCIAHRTDQRIEQIHEIARQYRTQQQTKTNAP